MSRCRLRQCPAHILRRERTCIDLARAEVEREAPRDVTQAPAGHPQAARTPREESVPGERAGGWCSASGGVASAPVLRNERALPNVRPEAALHDQLLVGLRDRVPGNAEREGQLPARGELRATGQTSGGDQRRQVLGELAMDRDIACPVGPEGDLDHARILASPIGSLKTKLEPFDAVRGGPSVLSARLQTVSAAGGAATPSGPSPSPLPPSRIGKYSSPQKTRRCCGAHTARTRRRTC